MFRFLYKTSALLLLIALALCAALSAAMVEPASKIKFDDAISLPGTGSGLALAGVGVRVKKLVGPVAVKVYACGFYCDKKAAAKRLAKFKGEKGGSKKLFDAVEAGAFDKIILLKMARKVGADKLVNALAESVKPRLSKGSEAALAQFQEVLLAGLKGGEAETGKQFGFGIHGGNKLVVTINGKKQGEIASAPLARAMLRTYLDDKAVSQDLKESVATGVLSFVNLA